MNLGAAQDVMNAFARPLAAARQFLDLLPDPAVSEGDKANAFINIASTALGRVFSDVLAHGFKDAGMAVAQKYFRGRIGPSGRGQRRRHGLRFGAGRMSAAVCPTAQKMTMYGRSIFGRPSIPSPITGAPSRLGGRA